MGEESQLLVVGFAGEGRPHSPFERRPSQLVRFLWPGPHPVRQDLAVQPVGLSRGVRGSSALEPEREAARSGAHPPHEQPAALCDQACLAQAGLAGHDDDAAPTGSRMVEGLPKKVELSPTADEGRRTGEAPSGRVAGHA